MNSLSLSKALKLEFPNLIRVYKDGSVDRFFGSPHVSPTQPDPQTAVSSKDVVISATNNISARLYLPNLTTTTTTKLPILVYYHGGGFCLESAFSHLDHRYMNHLAALARTVIVSVEYRLAPENPLPTAYEDSWEALNWTASLSDLWLVNHGDIEAVFVGGDSAGGNIVHNIIMRASNEKLKNNVKILGAFLSHPYFLDDKTSKQLELAYKIWEFVYPDAPGGPDSLLINPVGVGGPSLNRVGCSKVLVLVAEKDELRDGNVRYYEAMKKVGLKGKLNCLK